MKRRAFSLLLSLTLLFSLALPATTAYAEDGSSNKGMEISKTATANSDGSYTITLEAYATGAKVISDITKDVPTDIILVLDQSGSMKDNIGTVSFEQYKDESDRWSTTYHTRNQDYYEYRHNGGSSNLWHKLADGSYVSVSVKKSTEYTALSTSLVNYASSWGSISTSCYFYYANNLYEKVGEEYKKVEVDRQRNGYTYLYTYTFYDGSTVTSSGNDTVPNLGSHTPLYTPASDGANTVYTYTYTDSNGNVQTIGTSTGATTVFSPTLYKRVTDNNSGGSKLNALKSAVTSFVNNVNQKALGADGQYGTGDDVAHRIAIVGFASNSRDGNTELLSTQNETDYWSANDANYRDALVPACSANGNVNPRLSTAIERLGSSGDTYLEYGMVMANKIFEQYPITADDTSGRQRVVVVFTDGYPAPSGTNDFNYSMANNAIDKANTTKQTYKATVYTVGVFNTADPTADIETNFATDDGWWSDGWGESGNNLTDQKEAVAANRYMHYVSSNFPGATNLNQGGSMNPNANPFAGGDSYYLSAADSGSLNNIFQQISDQIETGGTTSTLTSDAVVKDIISPQFTLPAGTTAANITVETYACTGKDASGNYTWSKNADAMGARASISDNDKQVNVTGFNFSENYVGTVTENGNTTYRGNKLVISFTVTPRAGFLGGNNIYTNAGAGVYENANAENPVLTFNQPQVNVPIKTVAVTAEDKNVYLFGGLTAAQLKEGATVKVGGENGVTLDLSKADENYGLADWQTAYVDITVEVKDEGSNVITTDLTNLTADTTYTISVTVAPKTPSTDTDAATAQTGENDPANINVFKPELTFADSEVYYGADVPTNNDYSSNQVGTETWKHGDTVSTGAGVTMLGTKPMLNISYTPDASKISGGKYTKQDVPVKATVKIGTDDVTQYTTFVHQNCTAENCGWKAPTTPGDPAFLLHVKTCQLTITKTDGAADESYVFDVYKDGDKYSEVTIEGNSSQTIYELPIGTYTISENSGWSWRYSANNGISAVLTAQNPTGSITCINTKTDNQWLNGFSEVVRNIFGISH